MRYLRELIITVLLIGFCYLIYKSFQDKSQIDKYEKQFQADQVRMDSIIKLKNEATMVALEALTKAALFEQRFTQATLRAQTIQEKYDKDILRRPVARLSDAGIDSAVNRLVTKSQH